MCHIFMLHFMLTGSPLSLQSTSDLEEKRRPTAKSPLLVPQVSPELVRRCLRRFLAGVLGFEISVGISCLSSAQIVCNNITVTLMFITVVFSLYFLYKKITFGNLTDVPSKDHVVSVWAIIPFIFRIERIYTF